MTDSSFYITLPSNTGDYETNSTSRFTVRLPDTLVLDSNLWSVALSSIIYPFSFSLLDEEEGNAYIIIYRRYGQELRSIRIEIPDLHFKDEIALGQSLNSILLDVWEKELEQEKAASGNRAKRDAPTEPALKTASRVEESDEIKAMVEALRQQQTQTPAPPSQPTPPITKTAPSQPESAPQKPDSERPLKTASRVEESDEIKAMVEAMRQQQRLPAPPAPPSQPTSPKTAPSQPVSAPQKPVSEGPLKTATRVEESDEVKAAVEALRKQQQGVPTPPAKTQGKVPARIEESDDIKNQVAKLQKQKQRPADGTLTPIPESDRQPAPAPGVDGLSDAEKRRLMSMATRAAEAAWRQSSEDAKKAQEAEERATHHYSMARLKYARKDYVEKSTLTGENIPVRKTPEHLFDWVREQIEVLKQKKDAVSDNTLEAVNAASRAAEAKSDTATAVQQNRVADARKAADRAKNAQRTAKNAAKQAMDAEKEMETLSDEVIHKVDRAHYELDNPSEPVELPMPPPSPPPIEAPALEPPKPQPTVPTKLLLPSDEDEEQQQIDADFYRPKPLQPVQPTAGRKHPMLPSIEVTEEEEVIVERFPGKIQELPPTRPRAYGPTQPFSLPSIDESDEFVEPWFSSQLPPLPKPEKLTSAEPEEIDEEQQQIHYAQYAYPPQYRQMLLHFTKEHLAQPEYQWLSFHFDNVHQRFYVIFQGNVESILLSKQLAYTLGFDTRKLRNGQVGKYMPDVKGANQIFVYAPGLIQNSMLGNVMAPLLRIVNVSGQPGQSIEAIYTSEHHIRLNGNRHPEITIELRNTIGKLIKFHYGDCILTLHFQRSLF